MCHNVFLYFMQPSTFIDNPETGSKHNYFHPGSSLVAQRSSLHSLISVAKLACESIVGSSHNLIWQGIQHMGKPRNSDTVVEEVSGGGYVKEVGFKAVFEQRVEMRYTKINWPIIMRKKTVFLQEKSKEKQKLEHKWHIV